MEWIDIHFLINWIKQQDIIGIYAAFALIAFLENVVPPIPGDVIMSFGGYLALIGIVEPIVLLVTSAFGSLIGFMVMFLGAFFLGKDRLLKLPLMKYVITEQALKKIDIWMAKWGQGLIIANRFITGMRTVITITSGLTRMNILSVMIYAYISAFLWNATLIILGWILGTNWESISSLMQTYFWIVIIIVISFFGYRLYKKRKK